MWSAFDKALAAIRAVSPSDMGAGQKATLLGSLILGRLKWFWGTPVFPGEPDSMAAASYQQQIDIIDMRLAIEPTPELLQARQAAWGLMWVAFNIQMVSDYSRALTIEEYETTQLPRLELESMPTRIDYAGIKARVPLLDYVMRYQPVKRSGAGYITTCPMHSDARPSMHIYPTQNQFWCFVCNAGGDVIDYERARMKNDRALPVDD